MRAILFENLQEKWRIPFPGPRWVRACAIETHMDFSQEPFYGEFYRKNNGPGFTFHASLHNRTIYGYWTRIILNYFEGKFLGKKLALTPGPAFHTNLCNRNTYKYFLKIIKKNIYKKYIEFITT